MIKMRIYGYSDDCVEVEVEVVFDLGVNPKSIEKKFEFRYDPLARLLLSNGIQVAIAYGDDIPRVFPADAPRESNDHWVVKLLELGHDSLGHTYSPPDPTRPGTDVKELIIDADYITLMYGRYHAIGKKP
jgi:hypothetical protein